MKTKIYNKLINLNQIDGPEMQNNNNNKILF